MKTIPFSNDVSVALVDDDDYRKINKYRWIKNNMGYGTRGTGGTTYMIHRVIMGAVKGQFVDHIDGNPLNNQKNNLRLCTHRQNMYNRKIHRNNTSGYRGVVKVKEKWRAYIKVNYQRIHIGVYDTAEEAGRAYTTKAKELFGDFFRE